MNIRIILTVLFSFMVLLPVNAKKKQKKDIKQENVQNSVERILTNEELLLKKGQLESHIDSMTNFISQLEKESCQLSDSIRIINKDNENLSDMLAKRCIVTGSYFLNIPYTEEGVKVGIESYEGSKGTVYYNRNIIRLKLLESYRADAQELLNFLKVAKESKIKINPFEKVNRESTKLLTELNSLKMIKKYKEYTFWDETYLGKMILELENLLKSCAAGNKASADKMPSKIKEMGNKLNSMLKQIK